MHIIIPMSGFGERFRRAGYTVPKPLIQVDGMPIISYVINMFPKSSQFIFICNEDHLANPNYQMAAVLKKFCPSGKVVAIPAHKLGPVYAVSQCYEYIPDDDEVIVNYCDFTCDWDYQNFYNHICDSNPDGCIPSYRGFHPHLLGSTNYAYVRQKNLIVEDIQEKKPYTNNPMNEFASSGAYYFKNGAMLKKYFKSTIHKDYRVNGEYYVSMVYKPMLDDGLNISVYELNHFMQWGTPEDLKEYLCYSNIFKKTDRSIPQIKHKGTLLMPMVGHGSRFKDQGYRNIKPLISVSGKPMYTQAEFTLPQMEKKCFVLRKNMVDYGNLNAHVIDNQSNTGLVTTETMTDGQASSCMLAERHIENESTLLISACDHGITYDEEKYLTLLNDKNIDVIVWSVRGYANAVRNPHMYGWIKTKGDDSNQIDSVSVKKPLDNPSEDPIIIGTFTFKRGRIFKESAEKLFSSGERINGEFYVDSCINYAIQCGYNCVVFEVDTFMCWGTPNDLKCFEYWQNCFHFWPYHEYSIYHDDMIETDKKEPLIKLYEKQNQSKIFNDEQVELNV